MIIYITGIDGSGKSTIAQNLVDNIFKGKKTRVIWARYKPYLIKKILSPFKKNYVSDRANDHLMNAEEFSRWVTFKRKITKHPLLSGIIYFTQAFDYYLQIIKIIKIVKTPDTREIVLLDRYILDFIVDQSLNYGNISKNVITKFLFNKLKKIDLIFYIDVNEQTALGRKNDIPSMEFFQHKREYYKSYVTKLTNAYVINNEMHISSAIKEIETIINTKKYL